MREGGEKEREVEAHQEKCVSLRISEPIASRLVTLSCSEEQQEQEGGRPSFGAVRRPRRKYRPVEKKGERVRDCR